MVLRSRFLYTCSTKVLIDRMNVSQVTRYRLLSNYSAQCVYFDWSGVKVATSFCVITRPPPRGGHTRVHLVRVRLSARGRCIVGNSLVGWITMRLAHPIDLIKFVIFLACKNIMNAKTVLVCFFAEQFLITFRCYSTERQDLQTTFDFQNRTSLKSLQKSFLKIRSQAVA